MTLAAGGLGSEGRRDRASCYVGRRPGASSIWVGLESREVNTEYVDAAPGSFENGGNPSTYKLNL